MKIPVSRVMLLAITLFGVANIRAMYVKDEPWDVALAKELTQLERIQSLRSTPEREQKILELFNDITEKLILIDNSFGDSCQCCQDEIEQMHDAITSIRRVNDSLKESKRISRFALMQVGPVLQTTITLLGVINTTLDNKLKEMPNTPEMLEQKAWNKKMLRISAGVTTAIVGLVYLGNSYGWWAVSPDVSFMGMAQAFLRVIFG